MPSTCRPRRKVSPGDTHEVWDVSVTCPCCWGGAAPSDGRASRATATSQARAPRPRSAKCTAQDGQSRGLEPEAETPVERERRLVAELGVHDGAGDARLAHPVQCVGDQDLAVALALVRGIDGEALEVALAPGPTGDGIAEWSSAPPRRHPEPGGRHGPERFGEPGSVQAPERGEGGTIDGQHAAPVAPSGPPRGGPTTGRQLE